MTKKRLFWESFMVVMIILAIVEIFVEDLSRIFTWSISVRGALLIVGFLFDLIFTIEFTIRSILAPKEKGWMNYFLYEKGWVDFVSSVPLILFNSGPIMIGMFWPGKLIALPFLGMLNILKVTKILRVARVLRILRILKIFKSEGTNDAKEKRISQLNRIISVSVVTVTMVLIISPLFPKIFYDMDNNVQTKKQVYVDIARDWYKNLRQYNMERINYLSKKLAEDKNVIYAYSRGRTIVNNLGKNASPSKVIPQKYFYTDYKVLNYLGFKIWYSIQDIVIDNSRINFLIETIIVVLIISFFIFYKDPSAKQLK